MDEKSTVAVCGEIEASCICEREPGHEGAHACACGGKWAFDADGNFEIVAMPKLPRETIDTCPPMDLSGVLEGSRLGHEGQHEQDVLTHPDVQAAFADEETQRAAAEFEQRLGGNAGLGQPGGGT